MILKNRRTILKQSFLAGIGLISGWYCARRFRSITRKKKRFIDQNGKVYEVEVPRFKIKVSKRSITNSRLKDWINTGN